MWTHRNVKIPVYGHIKMLNTDCLLSCINAIIITHIGGRSVAKKFTQKEITLLKKNPYTLNVSESTLRFTKEFKEEFWRRYQAGERTKDIISALGYNLDILGDARVVGIYQHIKKEAYSEVGFHDSYQRPDPKTKKADFSSLSSEQALTRMQHELLYMRQELDFIKKIIKTDNSEGQKQ